LRSAPKRLQAVVAIGKNTSRRGLAPYELERLFSHMLPGYTVAREASGRPIVLGSSLQISLSHADGVTALALAPFPVGVDVECVDPDFDILDIDPALFGEQDFRVLQTCDVSSRRDCFYRLWTLKEANLKLRGRNLLTDTLPSISGARDTSTAWITSTSGRYCVGAVGSGPLNLSPRPVLGPPADRAGS